MKYLILTTLLLTACQSKKIDQRIYQTETLILNPNTKIETAEGIYISGAEKTIWFSAKKVEDLERKLSTF